MELLLFIIFDLVYAFQTDANFCFSDGCNGSKLVYGMVMSHDFQGMAMNYCFRWGSVSIALGLVPYEIVRADVNSFWIAAHIIIFL